VYQRDSGCLLLTKVALSGNNSDLAVLYVRLQLLDGMGRVRRFELGGSSVNSWVIWNVWGMFAFVAVLLGFVGRHFSVRTLRYVTAITGVALVVLITRFGLMHPADPAQASANLANSFTQGADELSAAFFHPLHPGNQVPAPGRIGWVVIAVLAVIGYRMLEAWARRREAPVLDTSALGDGRRDGASGKTRDSVIDGRLYDQLVAGLKFQLSAIEVRAPAILPGGSRSNGLASIAEASGVTGGNLAGAVIQFFGMLWPNPRRFKVRVRVESVPGDPPGAENTKVTVSLDEPATGQSVASKTMVAGDLDEAAAAVAGYVAQHIFIRDPATPPWCVGAANGSDLAAMLLAKQERINAKSPDDIRCAHDEQIRILEKATGNNQCAGIVRYELAQLYDLTGNHVAALRLHAVNREQHPRFYRGRYRLSMSLEMIANPAFRLRAADTDEDAAMLLESLAILNRCSVTGNGTRWEDLIAGRALRAELRETLLLAARDELRAIRRQLTLPHVIWGTFRHRDERVIRGPHWSLRKRQSFHDGLCAAELLVAIRRILNGTEPCGASEKPVRMRLATRRAADIARDNVSISWHLANMKAQDPQGTPGQQGTAGPPDRKWPPAEKRDRTRWLPWQRRTPSWEAAYNTACAYAALDLDDRVIISLQRAINNRDCELQRPWDWISQDPDFCYVKSSKKFKDFLDDQERNDYPAAIRCSVDAGGNERAIGCDVSSAPSEAVPAGSSP
jgi:hypothetical protein